MLKHGPWPEANETPLRVTARSSNRVSNQRFRTGESLFTSVDVISTRRPKRRASTE